MISSLIFQLVKVARVDPICCTRAHRLPRIKAAASAAVRRVLAKVFFGAWPAGRRVITRERGGSSSGESSKHQRNRESLEREIGRAEVSMRASFQTPSLCSPKPCLAFPCLSPRRVYNEKKGENEDGSREREKNHRSWPFSHWLR